MIPAPQPFDIIVFSGTFVAACLLMKVLNSWKSTGSRKKSKNGMIDASFRQKFRMAPSVPGPWPWPIIGNAASLGEAPHIAFDAMTKRYGPIFGIKIGNVPVIVLNNMKVIKEALTRQRDVFAGRPHFTSYKLVSLGMGAVFNDSTTIGDAWAVRKNKIVKHVHAYACAVDKREAVSGHIWDEVVYMKETLEKLCAQSPTGFVDPEQVIRVSVGNAVCSMCFGRKYEVDNSQFVQLLSMNREFGVVISAGSHIDVMPWIKIFPHYKRASDEFEALCLRMENWVLDKVTENTKTYTPGKIRNLIDSITEGELRENNEKYIPNGTGHGPNDLPIMDQIDHRVLAAIVNDIFGAGQDTLSSAFLFILHYMTRFPEIQSRIRNDIYEVTGHDRLPTLADRPKLPYMEAVFHEVMRHSSFVAITIPHLTLADTILCGYKVPKNTMVFINQYTANRDASVWEDPYSFKPERFLRTSGGKCQLDLAKVNKYTIFSTGSRRCPGDELSKIWIMLAMSFILHQCELLSDPDNPPTDAVCYGLTMKPANLRIKLRRLKRDAVK